MERTEDSIQDEGRNKEGRKEGGIGEEEGLKEGARKEGGIDEEEG